MASESPTFSDEKGNQVVVAADSSPFSIQAFEKALRSFDLKNTRFHVVHVRPPDEPLLLGALPEALRRHTRRVQAKYDKESQTILDEFREASLKAGAKHCTTVELTRQQGERGDVSSLLCKYCADNGATVLVIGCKGTRQAGRKLLGSVASYCLHNAPCSVLVYHGDTPQEKVVRSVSVSDSEPAPAKAGAAG